MSAYIVLLHTQHTLLDCTYTYTCTFTTTLFLRLHPFPPFPTLFFDHGRFRRSRPNSVHPQITATSLTDCLATVSNLSFLQLVQPCTHHFPHRQQSHRCFSHRNLFISPNFPHPKCNPRRKQSPRYLPFSTKPQLLVRTRLHPQPPRAHRQAGRLYSLLLSSLLHL